MGTVALRAMARYDAGHDNEGGLARHATQFEFKYAKAVARLLQDDDKEVRRAAAVALGQMGARGAEYVEAVARDSFPHD